MNYIGFDFLSIKAKGRNLHNFSMKEHTYLEVPHNLLHVGYQFSYELTNLYGTKKREHCQFTFLCMSAYTHKY